MSVRAFANQGGERVQGIVVEVRGGCLIMIDGDDGKRRGWFPFDGLRRLKERKHVER